MELNEQQVIEDYYKLRSCRAVSEKYGCSPETIRRILKRNGIKLTGWKTTPEHSLPKKKYPDRHKYQPVSYNRICEFCGKEFIAHDKRKRFCSRTCKDISCKTKKGVAVNVNPEPYQKICVVCGEAFETRRESVVCCSSRCSKKYRSPDRRYLRSWEEYVAELKAEAQARKDEKEKEKATANAIRIIQAIAEKRKDKYCAECGEVFHSEYPNKMYCSDRCQRKHRDRLRPKRRKNHSNRSIRSRCRKYGVYYDPSVKSELVFKRDGMVCQICGKKCDPMDHIWGDTGPLYPSVDHIIPLAKGGTHTWDNVQTAHIICNSFKRDLLEEEANCG